MRVLQIGKFYPISGGVEKVMYDITMGLSQKQVYCDMLCASAEKQDQGNLLLNDYARVLCAYLEEGGCYYAVSGYDLPVAQDTEGI